MNNNAFTNITVLILITATLFSCQTFYKANSISPVTSATSIDSLQKKDRFLILRNGEDPYYIKSLQLSADQKTAQCILELLPNTHNTYAKEVSKNKLKYGKKNPESSEVVNEVHFYISKDNSIALGNYTLFLDKVNKIEVLEHDKKRTTKSYVLGAVGLTVVGAAAAVALAASALSSLFSGFSLSF